ncbi:MAG: hypothetical protein WD740_06560 [Anaerolineales bacterium]
MKLRKTLFLLSLLILISIACNTILDLGQLVTHTSRPDSINPTDGSTSSTVPPFTNQDPPPQDTLLILRDTVVPENDPVDLADRFLGIENIPETVPPHGPYDVGDRRTFFVLDSGANVTHQTETELMYESDLVYFWVQVGVRVNLEELEALARAFEEQMVPTNRAFFGDEWIPGIDGDPHIYIVYTGNIGSHAAGVFVSGDAVHPLAEPQSNAAELFMVNSSNTPLGSSYAYTVLAHEHQHMIHWYRDRNETSWINEGMSELAAMLNGYINGGFVYEYLYDTDLQLNDWPNDQFATSPHYGAGFLFVTYFLNRFGAEATQSLVGDPANGLESVDNTLAQLGITDTQTGGSVTADDVVLDWAVANYVADADVGDGRYAYRQYPQVLEIQPLSEFEDCDASNITTDVRQYGVDYISFACSGERTLRFEGSNRTLLLPANAYSGDYMFWSNKGDESDMTLTRAFDFSEVSGPLTLSYQTWYDIEKDWDYVYALASTDQGDNWTFLQTPSGTDTNPLGNNYNFGYTSLSGDRASQWIRESIDLSSYAGQQVLLRFEYITDAAVNGEGFLVDDIAIEELDYFEDFESDEGGWVPDGFARVQNVLPQTFRIAMISQGDETVVQVIDVPATNQVDIHMDFNEADEVVLVIVGTTRFTRQPAVYNYGFLP